MTKVCILGLGQFGYALLKHLDRLGKDGVSLSAYDRNPEIISSLIASGRHPFLFTEEKVSNDISFSNDISVVSEADIIILALNSRALPEIFGKIKGLIREETIIINTSKALCAVSGALFSQLAFDTLSIPSGQYAAFSGGTIASDLFMGKNLGADIACADESNLNKLVGMFSSDNLKIEGRSDLFGVECAGAFKNVVSIACGIVEGAGMSFSSKARIFSQASQEAFELAIKHFGAKAETFSFGSQCWGDDLFLSCSDHTRNIRFGRLIGEGKSKEEALKILNMREDQIEGLNTISAFSKIEGIGDYRIFGLLERFFNGNMEIDEFLKGIFA